MNTFSSYNVPSFLRDMRANSWRVLNVRDDYRRIELLGPGDVWLRGTWVRGKDKTYIEIERRSIEFSLTPLNSQKGQTLLAGFQAAERIDFSSLVNIVDDVPKSISQAKKQFLRALNRSVGPKSERIFNDVIALLGAILPRSDIWLWSPGRHLVTCGEQARDLRDLNLNVLLKNLTLPGHGLLMDCHWAWYYIDQNLSSHETLIRASQASQRLRINIDRWKKVLERPVFTKDYLNNSLSL